MCNLRLCVLVLVLTTATAVIINGVNINDGDIVYLEIRASSTAAWQRLTYDQSAPGSVGIINITSSTDATKFEYYWDIYDNYGHTFKSYTATGDQRMRMTSGLSLRIQGWSEWENGIHSYLIEGNTLRNVGRNKCLYSLVNEVISGVDCSGITTEARFVPAINSGDIVYLEIRPDSNEPWQRITYDTSAPNSVGTTMAGDTSDAAKFEYYWDIYDNYGHTFKSYIASGDQRLRVLSGFSLRIQGWSEWENGIHSWREYGNTLRNVGRDKCLYGLSGSELTAEDCAGLTSEARFVRETLNPTSAPTRNPTRAPTRAPTADPSRSPTKYPSEFPTNFPTKFPTQSPSKFPTESPSKYPTNNPSKYPTQTPSKFPTTLPSTTPSKMPTNPPTLNPTYNPSVTPTLSSSSPTRKPTIVIPQPTPAPIDDNGVVSEEDMLSTELTDVTGEDGLFITDQGNEYEDQTYFQLFTGILSVSLIFLVVTSYIDATWFRRNDFYRLGAILAASFHMLDVNLDAMFLISLTFHDKWAQSGALIAILLLGITFLVVPIALTVIQLHRQINQIWSKYDSLRVWLTSNITLLYVLSFVCGSSFAAVQLCTSNIFKLPQFDLPLTKTQMLLYQTKMVFTTVLLENVPQLFLQTAYLLIISDISRHGFSITYVSIVCSAISIIIAIIAKLTQKKILTSQHRVSIKFDVTGQSVIQKISACQSNVYELRKQISGILGVHYEIIEITKPQQIPDGLAVNINLFVNNTKAIDTNYHKIMQNANKSGKIAPIIMDCWALESCPSVSNIDYVQHQSKQRNANTVVIKSDSEPITSTDQLTTATDQMLMNGEGGINNNQAIIQMIDVGSVSKPQLNEGNKYMATAGGPAPQFNDYSSSSSNHEEQEQVVINGGGSGDIVEAINKTHDGNVTVGQ